MRRLLVRDLFSQLDYKECFITQKSPEYLESIETNMVDITDRFIQKNKLSKSGFVKDMNRIFNTTRFQLLLNRWLIDYSARLFSVLDDFSAHKPRKELELEDAPLNRFAVEEYSSIFGVSPKVTWRRRPGMLKNIFSILARCMAVLYLALNRGLKVSEKKEEYKVMREAIWGLRDTGGYYFHDDFMVDRDRIKKEDLLLYSRGVPTEKGRLKAYHDARESPYRHFDLYSLSLGVRALFLRVIPKYILSGSKALIKEIHSPDFSLYWSVYLYFVYNALPYERVFSHFKIISELGHNYFSGGHIVESIICQNYGARYYLMHWSDSSIPINRHLLSFLGCDSFLTWGNAHVEGVRTNPEIFVPTGYIFKRFIKETSVNRDRILYEMGIAPDGKIVSFFDEAFGGRTKMTEENYVTFWKTALMLAIREKNITVLMRPKTLEVVNRLPADLKREFLRIKNEMEGMSNVYIMDSNRWSFIEAIGVSDIVVTQGMSSSATIAIICGIQGLYLDQAKYDHLFSRLFKDKVVFDDPEKLISMVQKIIAGMEAPLGYIPEDILRQYDAYPDCRGIDVMRDALTREG